METQEVSLYRDWTLPQSGPTLVNTTVRWMRPSKVFQNTEKGTDGTETFIFIDMRIHVYIHVYVCVQNTSVSLYNQIFFLGLLKKTV